MTQPLLSICIPTLASRTEKFNALRAKILKQCCDMGFRSVTGGEGVWLIGSGETSVVFPLVEILWDKDQGEKPVGAKRQDMLKRSTGRYVCGIDDDDEISGDYISSIVAAVDGLESLPDCIGFDIDCYGYGPDPTTLERARVSNRYREWAQDVDGFRYVRCPHHLMPILREHALAAGFPNLTYREDSNYSFRLRDLDLLKTEAFIEKVLYTVLHEKGKQPGR